MVSLFIIAQQPFTTCYHIAILHNHDIGLLFHNMASVLNCLFYFKVIIGVCFYLIKLVNWNWNCISTLRCGKVDILQYNNRGLGLSQHS